MPQKATAKILLPSLIRPLSIDTLYLLQFSSNLAPPAQSITEPLANAFSD
jgi:hypothetical protein